MQMPTNNQQPILYILMRTDLDSLNPGKAMAQACHAANQFVFEIKNDYPKMNHVYKQWESEGGSFGTTIVLDGGTHERISGLISMLKFDPRYVAGMVMDETYPIRDGQVTWTLPVETCGFIFCTRENAEILSSFSLHP